MDASRLERAARALLEAVGECDHFDHHGYCQTHFVSKPCEVAALRAAIAALEAAAAKEVSRE